MAPDTSRGVPSQKGSVHDMPAELVSQLQELEQAFAVDTAKLHRISDHFKSELLRGLSKEGGNIPMNPTWVIGYPTGDETGTFLALDMGGTNLRVCEVVLSDEKGGYDIHQSKYRLPEAIKTGTGDQLFDYLAECVKQFLLSNNEGKDINEFKDWSLGFTFSYPCTQDAIDNGILQRWTKGFDISGVEGHDVVPMFEAALERKGVPVKITALVNDTTGTLIASGYTNPATKIGCIFGTGCNAAYLEDMGCIPKLEHMGLDPNLQIAINCEWGAFDNEHVVLPRTVYDKHIDKTSPRPGQQTFEKMVAGLYLGELLRLVLVDLHSNPDVNIFKGQNVESLRAEYTLDSSFLSAIEEDSSEDLKGTHALFIKTLSIDTTEHERKLIRRLAELIGTRAARLTACGIAAICKMKGWNSCHVGADGSLFAKYPRFATRQAQALRELFGWDSATERNPIEVGPSEDGSGVGAALIAALTIKRINEGIYCGVNARRRNSLLSSA